MPATELIMSAGHRIRHCSSASTQMQGGNTIARSHDGAPNLAAAEPSAPRCAEATSFRGKLHIRRPNCEWSRVRQPELSSRQAAEVLNFVCRAAALSSEQPCRPQPLTRSAARLVGAARGHTRPRKVSSMHCACPSPVGQRSFDGSRTEETSPPDTEDV